MARVNYLLWDYGMSRVKKQLSGKSSIIKKYVPKKVYLRIPSWGKQQVRRVKMYMKKTGYKSIFCFFYSTDSSLQKHECIFLRNECFGKYGWVKGKRGCFNAMIDKNETFFAMKYAHLSYKKWGNVFRKEKVRTLMT